MGVYRGSSCRLCRREGEKLFLKGLRCYTDKCSIERRNYFPGQHGPMGRTRYSDYGVRLREKQKVKRMYGLLEKQFRNIFEKARKIKGDTGEIFLSFLERRLDNVIYRLGFARSRREARQLVSHGHVRVNGKKVDIPSFFVKKGDIVELSEKAKKFTFVEEALSLSERRGVPEWLELEREKKRGVVKELPRKEHISTPIQVSYIVELYSK